ncbi:MAG: hypothetical protein MMC23_001370 [Stictis urceolatum]|nr:hypothetical protein [Stictis urceolata]
MDGNLQLNGAANGAETSSSSASSYWFDYLNGLEPCYFPTIKDKHEKADKHEEAQELRFAQQMLLAWAEVSVFASRNSIATSDVCQMVWALVLKVYANSEDVCFGYLASSRDLPAEGIENAVGASTNLLVCRSRLPDDMLVRTALIRIRDETTQSLSHRTVSLAEIQHRLGKTPSEPFFNTTYSFQKRSTEVDATEFNGGAQSLDPNTTRTQDSSEYDIAANIEAKDGGAGLRISYKIDKLSTEQAENIAHLFNHLLQVVVQSPGLAIGELDLLSSHNLKQIASWNEKPPGALNSCVHEIVARNARELPSSAQAISGWDRSFTYTELDNYASLLAHHLRSLGVGPGSYVPLCFEKSAWTIVAMLAVLKAGCAFVPLDPKHPTTRLRDIIMDIESNTLLCSTSLQDTYTSAVKNSIAVDDHLFANLPTIKTDLPQCSYKSPAYIIYTSGSTGKPKGVVIEHGSFCTSAVAHGERLNMLATSRVLQFASYAFDASVLEILTTLICKACVCVPSERMRLDDLSGSINDMRITWALLTPSVLQTIKPSMVPGLRTLVTGAEAASESQISSWTGNLELFNAYGPTECAVISTISAQPYLLGSQNIGRAVGGRCWIVNAFDHNKLVPLGCVGELVVEGPILARGYFKDTLKTNESFVDRPRWGYSNHRLGIEIERIYKTGDLARYAFDGTIVFHGRKDSQMKLHGQRVEAGEIEHHLRADGHVENVLVTVPIRGRFKGRLVAALSLCTSSALLPNAEDFQASDRRMAAKYLPGIRERLFNPLPSYMIPSRWLVVDSLPLTTSAKLDRRKILRWIEYMGDDDAQSFLNGEIPSQVLPGKPALHEKRDKDGQGASETALAVVLKNIWSQVFKIPEDRISTNASFLALGGDSIASMLVMALCREKGIVISLREVLTSESITQLAATLDSRQANQDIDQATEKEGKVFRASPIQRLFLRTAKNESLLNWYNQSSILRLLKKKTDMDVEQAVKELVARHSMLRARFCKNQNGAWEQRITTDIDSSYRYRSVHVDSLKDIIPAIRTSQRCMDINNGPLIAATLINVEGFGQALAIIVHQLVVDAISWRILLHDFEAALEQRTRSPTKPLSFQTWCHEQEKQARLASKGQQLFPSGVPSSNMSYWGMETSSNVYGDIAEEKFVLDQETTNKLLIHSHKALNTESVDIFVSAIMQTFNAIFPDRDVPAIFNAGHGRESWSSAIDPSGTVGWFTSISPVYVPTIAEADYLQTLRSVKDVRYKMSGNGQQYFVHSLLDEGSTASSKNLERMEILFSYLGSTRQVGDQNSIMSHLNFATTSEELEMISDVSPRIRRMALVEINAALSDDVLHFSFNFNKHMNHQEKLRTWVLACKQRLEKSASLLSTMTRSLTLSDVPLLSMTYKQLQVLSEELSTTCGITDFGDIQDIYPCSPLQEGILLAQYKKPGRYFVKFVFEVRSGRDETDVDTKRLRTAWNHVIDRHAALRTVFVHASYGGGSICQVVLKHMDSQVSTVQCKDLEAIRKLEQISAIHRPEDGTPLNKITIYETTKSSLFLKIELNHAVIDGTSMGIILQDLSEAYNKQIELPMVESYGEYVKYINDMQLASDAYWINRLRGTSPCIFPVHSSEQYELGDFRVLFGRAPELQARCIEAGVTVSSAILTAWAVILQSYTQSDEVCFGYLASGRDAPVKGVQDIVGPLINMLVLRIRLGPADQMISLAQKTQEGHLENLSHQHTSWTHVQHELKVPQGGLFNTAVSIDQTEVAIKHGEGIRLDPIMSYDPSEVRKKVCYALWEDTDTGLQYAITLNATLADVDGGITLAYWKDAIPTTCIEEVATLLSKVLNAMIDAPHAEVAHVELPGFKSSQPNHVKSAPIYSNAEPTILQEPSLDLNGTRPSTPQDGRQNQNVVTMTKLRSLWACAMGMTEDQIGDDDDFFRLGGDSMMALSMASMARDQDIIVSVYDIFQNPSLRNMAAAVCKRSVKTRDIRKNVSEDTDQLPEKYRGHLAASVDRNSESGEIVEFASQQLKCSKEQIQDVLPVTDYQAFAVSNSMLKCQWMLNYFSMDWKGPLHVQRLEDSVRRIVEQQDILRTVFILYKGEYLQAVLRQYMPKIDYCETDQDLTKFNEDFERSRFANKAQLGQSYLQITVVRCNRLDITRIFIRLNHAQYDGVSLPRMLVSLRALYDGTEVQPMIDFSEHIRYHVQNGISGSYAYWKDLLRGAEMTPIVRREYPAKPRFQNRISAEPIDCRTIMTRGITPASIIRAAWSLTLANIAAKSDVTFGSITSGRNSGLADADMVVGPCINVIPVRVKMQQGWTALNLMNHVQAQQTSSMPFESLGFRDIFKHCTDWTGQIGFTTFVHHMGPAEDLNALVQYGIADTGSVGSDAQHIDLSAVSRMVDAHNVAIEVSYSKDSEISDAFAKSVLDMVCEFVKGFEGNPNAVLPSPADLTNLPTTLPLKIQPASITPFSSLEASTKNANIQSTIDYLASVWSQALSRESQGLGESVSDLSFFDLGGDMADLGKVAAILRSEGYVVYLEELLDRPLLLDQVVLLHGQKLE